MRDHLKSKIRFFIWIIIAIIIIAVFFIYNFIYIRMPYLTSSLTHKPIVVFKEKPKHTSQQVITILAIDGGGTRGIIPLYVLKYIEAQTGRPISDSFNIITGTSSGGITTVLLTLPKQDGSPKYTAQDALNLYTKLSPQIFAVPLYHKILTLNGLLGPKFISQYAHQVFQTMTQGVTLNQLRGHVLLPSLEIQKATPFVWSNKENPDYYVSDVLAGTTAAMSYFQPVTVFSLNKKTSHTIMDIGIYQNDPALLALIEATNLYPNKKYLLVSLGTGLELPNIRLASASKWGLLQWIPNLYSLAGYIGTQSTNDIIMELSQAKIIDVTYYRINMDIPNAIAIEFDSSPKNLALIDKYGKQMIKENKTQLNQIVNQLLKIQTQH